MEEETLPSDQEPVEEPSQRPAKEPSPEPKIFPTEEKKDIFGEKPYILREKLRKELKKESLLDPKIKVKEGIALEKEVFKKEKYGKFITKKEVGMAFKDLKKEQYRARDIHQKYEIKKKTDLLKKVFGK